MIDGGVAATFSSVVACSLVVASISCGACKKDDASTPKNDGTKTTTTNPSASSSAVASANASASALEIVGKRVDVDVGEHGFTPSEITVKKDDPTTLVFTRTSNSTCAFEVVFPELNLTKDLPLNRPVAVVVPTAESRTYAFQCGMGMYKSKVVVQ